MNEKLSPHTEVQKEFGEIERFAHRIAIFKYGTREAVGEASIVENNKPVPHLILLNLDVHKAEERGKGFASQIMEEVERMSKEKGKPVILYDVTDRHHKEQNPKAIGMYGKREGWTQLIGEDGIVTNRWVYGTTDRTTLEALYQRYK